MLMSACSERAVDNCTDVSYHWVFVHFYVERLLKSPGTAKFPFGGAAAGKYLGDCTYKFNTYVDSQNGFGAMLRTRFTMTTRYGADGNMQVVNFQLFE